MRAAPRRSARLPQTALAPGQLGVGGRLLREAARRQVVDVATASRAGSSLSCDRAWARGHDSPHWRPGLAHGEVRPRHLGVRRWVARACGDAESDTHRKSPGATANRTQMLQTSFVSAGQTQIGRSAVCEYAVPSNQVPVSAMSNIPSWRIECATIRAAAFLLPSMRSGGWEEIKPRCEADRAGRDRGRRARRRRPGRPPPRNAPRSAGDQLEHLVARLLEPGEAGDVVLLRRSRAAPRSPRRARPGRPRAPPRARPRGARD